MILLKSTRARAQERTNAGKAQRTAMPRSALADCVLPDSPARDLAWLNVSNQGRVPELLGVRHARMHENAFAFYRGAAALMANDLARLPHSGIFTQLCGDAHLSNFGFFASPERELLFDINDFDETASGPFDWDLRRLATSFVIGSQALEHKSSTARNAVQACIESYRERMAGFAKMDTLQAWYYRLTSDTLLDLGKHDEAELKVIAKAKQSTSRTFAADATEMVEGQLMIRDQVPFVYHTSEQATVRELTQFRSGLKAFWQRYVQSMAPERRILLSRYALHDVAVLTPGVGSVGRRCFVLLLVADGVHPLFLQCKEVVGSVIPKELSGGAAAYEHQGERVVQGQRLMQAASDIFLGWASDTKGRTYHVRQLRDMKAAYKLEDFSAHDMEEYGQACGYALARAHAKAGDAALISAYMGKSKKLDQSLGTFAQAYAKVNAADFAIFSAAIAAGKLPIDLAVADGAGA
jgi:uncharacterized protein (DUF2252 family)